MWPIAKTNWSAGNCPTPEDFNRSEGRSNLFITGSYDPRPQPEFSILNNVATKMFTHYVSLKPNGFMQVKSVSAYHYANLRTRVDIVLGSDVVYTYELENQNDDVIFDYVEYFTDQPNDPLIIKNNQSSNALYKVLIYFVNRSGATVQVDQSTYRIEIARR